MAGSIILHDPGGCCALAKKKWNGVQKRERRATVSGPRAHSQWPGTRDRTETALPQQTKATCSKQPSLLGSKSKVQTSDRTEKFSVACLSRYKYSMSNTYDFSQSTDLSCIFVFNMWRSFLCIFFPLHFLSFFIFLGFSPFLFFLEHHLWVLRPLLEKKLNKRVNRSFASTQFNLFHFSFNKSLWAIKNTFIWLLKI